VRQHPLDLVVCPVLTAFIHIDTSSAVLCIHLFSWARRSRVERLQVTFQKLSGYFFSRNF
jgi:hypothetical protein